SRRACMLDAIDSLRPDLDGFNSLAWPLDLSGWGSDAPLFKQLIEEMRPRLIIEVGTWKGASAIHMARICDQLGIATRIVCIDTWLGAYEFISAGDDARDLKKVLGYPNIYYQFLANVVQTGHERRIIPFPQTSLIAARYLWHHQIRADLIYIDGSHDYDDVAADIRAYWPLLRRGGVLFGDDYESFNDIRRAVNESAHMFTLHGGRYWEMRHD
ncbi:MAG: class I SAM-dependent methyltransferase, partial [Gammaproteobacteria bacterium]